MTVDVFGQKPLCPKWTTQAGIKHHCPKGQNASQDQSNVRLYLQIKPKVSENQNHDETSIH